MFPGVIGPAGLISNILLSILQAAADAVHAEASLSSYETMVVLRPDLTDEQRDSELAKFEAFLRKNGASEIQVTIRGRQRLAYPIKSFVDGIYVLYTFDANPQVVAPVQKLLSTPTAGAELNVLRHITFRI
jgi:small subunit ribosomal protein S6